MGHSPSTKPCMPSHVGNITPAKGPRHGVLQATHTLGVEMHKSHYARPSLGVEASQSRHGPIVQRLLDKSRATHEATAAEPPRMRASASHPPEGQEREDSGP